MRTYLQSIGHYQIHEKLGRGGMADVYLAVDTRNERQVALKLVENGECGKRKARIFKKRSGKHDERAVGPHEVYQ